MILSNVSPDVSIVVSAPPSPSLTEIDPSATLTTHLPSPSMSKRYELLIPASFDASARDSSESKNSFAATLSAPSVEVESAVNLPKRASGGAGLGHVTLDQQVREPALRRSEEAAILLELGRPRPGRAQRLPLGDDAPDLVGERLDGLADCSRVTCRLHGVSSLDRQIEPLPSCRQRGFRHFRHSASASSVPSPPDACRAE